MRVWFRCAQRNPFIFELDSLVSQVEAPCRGPLFNSEQLNKMEVIVNQLFFIWLGLEFFNSKNKSPKFSLMSYDLHI